MKKQISTPANIQAVKLIARLLKKAGDGFVLIRGIFYGSC